MMNDERKKDLRERTKAFALRILEVVAIFVSSVKTAKKRK